MGSEALVAAPHKPIFSALDVFKRAQNGLFEPFEEIGSSSCLNLHARFTVKIFANGETIGFASKKDEEKKDKNVQGEINALDGSIVFDTNEPLNHKPSSERGEHHQKGLTSYAKRCMRVLAYQYQKRIEEEGSTAKSCSFSTFSFKRILPNDDKQGKEMYRAMLERIRRAKGNIHYVWVAEKQEGKTIKGKDSYRKKHGQSVIHFHLLSPERFEKQWINTNWNEVVANRYLKDKKIDLFQYRMWMEELYQHNKYCERLDKWRAQKRTTKPKQPEKAEFLLLPNVIAVYDASRYMGKYISKESGKIPGHLWGMSYESKPLVKPEVTTRYFDTIYEADQFTREVLDLMKATNKDMEGDAMLFRWKDYNDYTGFWCNDKTLFQGCYAQVLEKPPEKKEPQCPF